jgi:hypothetical protein
MARRGLSLLSSSLLPLFLVVVWQEVRVSRAGAPPPTADVALTARIVFLDHTERLRDRGGHVTWQLEADRIEVHDGGEYLIYGLRHAQYFTNGVSELHLRADRARVDGATRNLVAQGNLRLYSDRGLVCDCDRAYWDEAQGQLLVPKVDRCEWRDPLDEQAPPALITTTRLFYRPAITRLDLPDPLSATRGRDSLQAAAGSSLLNKSELQLLGPATLSVGGGPQPAAGQPAAGQPAAGQPAPRRLTAAVGAGGRMAYDRRTGGALLVGAATVDLPDDAARLSCDQATYSGVATQRVEAEGHLVLTDPANQLRAERGSVATAEQRAEFGAPLHLDHHGSEGLTTIEAQHLVYVYRRGATRAEADGAVQVETSEASVTAGRLRADLEAEVADFGGGVKLLTKPTTGVAAGADELAEAKARPVELRAERLRHVFAAGRRLTEASGSPRFRQGDREGTAQHLRYDHERELLTLDGAVRLWDKDGQRARCARLTYDTRTDQLTVEKAVSAEFWLKGDLE